MFWFFVRLFLLVFLQKINDSVYIPKVSAGSDKLSICVAFLLRFA